MTENVVVIPDYFTEREKHQQVPSPSSNKPETYEDEAEAEDQPERGLGESGQCSADDWERQKVTIQTNDREIYIGKNISLYENDYVFNLFEENLEDNIYRSPSLWLVEFYRHWCGYCRRAVPHWKALAEDIKEKFCYIPHVLFLIIPIFLNKSQTIPEGIRSFRPGLGSDCEGWRHQLRGPSCQREVQGQSLLLRLL